eukprot:23566-Eustigmatos_ZCMA.PRE.1
MGGRRTVQMEGQEVGGRKRPEVRAKDLLSNCHFARARSTVTVGLIQLVSSCVSVESMRTDARSQLV